MWEKILFNITQDFLDKLLFEKISQESHDSISNYATLYT